ncbi:DUF2284 domain-containing protein [Methanorbis furvi]|uniref:Metal-binding protein n=1 Tax=Methanorbis furvi TaxID=3028299 RepID=A0AAE4MF39_9EURY|nr:hypothetical protein [Methanocorpusculaceae archaeon Ag1]
MKKYSADEEIQRLTEFVREKGGDAMFISSDKVITGEWVRMKCLFGCNGFGRRFSCPPYTPTPSETRAVLDCYSHALLVRFEGDVGETTPERLVSREMTRYVQTIMYELENMAFHDGFYKAFGYTGHQCGWCGKCCAKEEDAVITDCKNRRKMRPSMEAAGIDVYATCKNAGWDLGVLECTQVEGGTVLNKPMTTVMLLLVE